VRVVSMTSSLLDRSALSEIFSSAQFSSVQSLGTVDSFRRTTVSFGMLSSDICIGQSNPTKITECCIRKSISARRKPESAICQYGAPVAVSDVVPDVVVTVTVCPLW